MGFLNDDTLQNLVAAELRIEKSSSFVGDIVPLLTSLEFENQVQLRLMNHDLALTAAAALDERVAGILEMLRLEGSR